ncbi:ubiquitin carboxyl-terminal hydrolase 12-like protein [Vairimorpha apis BRL 01]|uniref:Ubiquitin carboxyl-terminal hydrolase 12-like protein n=1 Tax=Vairimorpha apis BRL 01 TaxID=1037528 RepID=T0LDB9_9MICR|nr:ubiquitin carboxyl-terminal hydrolase 12-like protein [Vairimorpha apis BRL 01]
MNTKTTKLSKKWTIKNIHQIKHLVLDELQLNNHLFEILLIRKKGITYFYILYKGSSYKDVFVEYCINLDGDNVEGVCQFSLFNKEFYIECCRNNGGRENSSENVCNSSGLDGNRRLNNGNSRLNNENGNSREGYNNISQLSNTSNNSNTTSQLSNNSNISNTTSHPKSHYNISLNLIYISTYDSKQKTTYTGLKNLGATCYINSFMQTLFHINKFQNDIF